MSKKTKGGSGNVLLLAGLGVGAFMLFANKSNAQSSELPSGSAGGDIPDAPKILAVNSSATESPAPTGIVSDEEGMEATASSGSSSPSQSSYNLPAASSSDDGEDDSNGSYSGGSAVVKTVTNAGIDLIKQAQEAAEIPPLVSTKLTPKETAIINSGKLTAALALKRPDLYKAAYIKKYGGKTAAGKRKALIDASLAIDAAVNAATAAKNGGLIKAVQYPAKPEFTFVQSAGGMAAQVAMSQIAALQKAGVQVSPAAQKVSTQVKAAKASKGKHSAKPAQRKTPHAATQHPATHPAYAVKKTAHSIVKKHVVNKHH